MRNQSGCYQYLIFVLKVDPEIDKINRKSIHYFIYKLLISFTNTSSNTRTKVVN